jgi:hypothetical protein
VCFATKPQDGREWVSVLSDTLNYSNPFLNYLRDLIHNSLLKSVPLSHPADLYVAQRQFWFHLRQSRLRKTIWAIIKLASKHVFNRWSKVNFKCKSGRFTNAHRCFHRTVSSLTVDLDSFLYKTFVNGLSTFYLQPFGQKPPMCTTPCLHQAGWCVS